MDTFLSLESELDRETKEETEAKFCDSLEIVSDDDALLKSICISFVKLFKILKMECANECSNDGSKYPKFMNFWLNYKLRSIANYENIKENFYNKFPTKYSEFKAHDILNGKIYHINQEKYKNMNILYKLYKIIDEIKEGKKKYETGIDEFKTNYNEALKQCFLETDDNLYNALDKFREYYESKMSKIDSCTNDECPTLPQLINKFQKIDSGTTMIGNKLIQYDNINLYNELTKISKNEHKNLMVLVALQYNLPFEHDKNENKRLLMNILYEFFQYWDINKNNNHLFEFIAEFINKYYKHKEKHYNEIFKECGSNNKPEKYCKIYNKCNTDFYDDFSLIKDNINNYLTQKKKYFNNLTTDDSWIDRAIAIFDEFGAGSKNLPTIMSTTVAIILFLFILFKLTPFSSIFRKKKKRKRIPVFFPERIKDENSANKNVKPKRGKIIFSYQPT